MLRMWKRNYLFGVSDKMDMTVYILSENKHQNWELYLKYNRLSMKKGKNQVNYGKKIKSKTNLNQNQKDKYKKKLKEI